MEHKKKALLFICLAAILSTVTLIAFKGSAQTMPDLSSLDFNYLLPDNQQVLQLSSGGFAVLSTDSVSCSYLTLLNPEGKLDCDSPAVFPFVYRSAAVSENTVYLDGDLAGPAPGIQIYQYKAPGGTIMQNRILHMDCDYSRGMYADRLGRIYLVTGPDGAKFGPASPFWVYNFSEDPGVTEIKGSPAPDFNPSTSSSSSSAPSEESSSQPPAPSSEASSPSSPISSSPVSSEASSLPSQSSSPSSNPPDSSQSASSDTPAANPYRFAGTVTVESLQQQLDAQGRGARVRVTSPAGQSIPSGCVGTGDFVEVLLNGRVDSRVAAIIPGDVIGTGKLDPADLQVLSAEITNRQGLSGLYLQAGDVNQDGKIDTSDLLQIKNMIGSVLD